MLSTRLTPHLTKLARTCPAIGRQFIRSEHEEIDDELTTSDPLMEEEHTAVRGLVHKYDNRALVLLTMNCAAYCRFCTRRRKVSDIERGMISRADLDRMEQYLKQHPNIKELVISGGDPLTVPDTLKLALAKFSRLPQIKVIRIGTRLPVSNPSGVNNKILSALRLVKKQPLYLMLHFEHPAELNQATIQAVKKLQPVSSMMFSQTIFLKGVNDNFQTLYDLFSGLIEIGIKPYYLYRCDYVKGAAHFIVPFEQEIKIMTKLRANLSGLACPMYVIDACGGAGKIPVPLNFWKFDRKQYQDFKGKRIKV